MCIRDRDRLPEYARDLKLNLSSLASEELLSPQQKAGSFTTAALAANHAPTTQAVVDAFGSELTPEALSTHWPPISMPLGETE